MLETPALEEAREVAHELRSGYGSHIRTEVGANKTNVLPIGMAPLSITMAVAHTLQLQLRRGVIWLLKCTNFWGCC